MECLRIIKGALLRVTLSLLIVLTLMGPAWASDGPLALTNGANQLTATQNADGGWGWPLTGTSATNTVGPIAMGLAQAYRLTHDSTHYSALIKAGVFLLAKTNTFSPSDGYLAAQLDRVFGVTTYTDHVKTCFYNKLASGTYDRKGLGTLYSTEQYVQSIRTSRAGAQANMAAWDIGLGLVGAASVGADTSAWIAGTKAEINELDGGNYYDVIGLAGAIYGLAFVNEDFDPTAGQHVAASTLTDLADILATYQLASGGFTWNSNYVIDNDFNEAIQETAYAVLALDAVSPTAYAVGTLNAREYLISVQLGTGGWEQYSGSGENNEVTGEALWALANDTTAPTASPTPDPAANSAGWNNSDVTVTWNWTDAAGGSGIDPAACTLSSVSSGEGTLLLTATCTDLDGNIGTATYTVQVDKTPPTIAHADVTAVATSAAGAVVNYDTPTSSDTGGSGVITATCGPPPAGATFPIQTTLVTCTATDAAGNVGTGTFNVTVTDVSTPGQMYGDGWVSKDKDKYHFNFNVSEGAKWAWRNFFRLDVDGKGWSKHNDGKFYATKFTFIAFKDEAGYGPGRRPKTNIDTVLFSGTGTWNKTQGCTFEVKATDKGEPARKVNETISITIGGGVGCPNPSITVAGTLSGGNIQSLRVKR